MARQTMRVAHVTQMTRALKRAAELTGGWTALAEALSEDGHRISKQACHNWNYRGVPAERALQIEKVTRGVVPRHELRPDLFSGYVRQEVTRG
jgi:DNA-binding transcriptional regulator YdaS (Cro superfamily)